MKKVSNSSARRVRKWGGREDELTGADFHGEKVELENGTSKETLEAARRKMEEGSQKE